MDVNETRRATEVMLDFVKTGVAQYQKHNAINENHWDDCINPRWDFITYKYRKKRVPQTRYITKYKYKWGNHYATKREAECGLDTSREGARVIKWVEVIEDE